MTTREDALYEFERCKSIIQNNKMDWLDERDIPVLDVAIEALQEQKTGKWIVDDEYIDCSYCRREKWSRVPYEQLVSRFRFCPNCGAKMEVADD